MHWLFMTMSPKYLKPKMTCTTVKFVMVYNVFWVYIEVHVTILSFQIEWFFFYIITFVIPVKPVTFVTFDSPVTYIQLFYFILFIKWVFSLNSLNREINVLLLWLTALLHFRFEWKSSVINAFFFPWTWLGFIAGRFSTWKELCLCVNKLCTNNKPVCFCFPL